MLREVVGIESGSRGRKWGTSKVEKKRRVMLFVIYFFFQAEDGIRDWSVTGVQTCALPICNAKLKRNTLHDIQ